MCTRFRLIVKNLFNQDPPRETILTLTQVLAVPGHWSAENYVPPELVLWAVRHHEKHDNYSCAPVSPDIRAVATHRYTLVAL